MDQFTISGFSDEIDPKIKMQFTHLKKLGISYFEPRNIDGVNISDLTEDAAKKLKEQMDLFGIKASSIGSPIGKIKITDDFMPHLEKLKHTITIAKILETNYIRVFSFYLPEHETPESYREEVISRMRAMTRLAEQEGVVLLHENEKGIYGDIAPRCKVILESVNSPNLRAVFDPANFIQCGQKVYPDAYEMIRPYIVYMHVKDALENGHVVPAGTGEGNWKSLLCALKESGYRGFLSLEPHLGDFCGLSDLEHGEMMQGLEASDATKFSLAYTKLVEILKEVDPLWNK